ncbi:outer membrane lipoprotein-sorting protein [Emticicia sp. 17c]|uniref:outer membrane lipoprotein-sorting protein n=1 Tax=Emticicia sp. 17c TaxID=3127704 RepID=UPI00301DDB80
MRTTKLMATVVAAFISVSTFAQTVDEIVDKHVAALGGLDKLKSITSISTERSLAVQGMEIPSQTVLLVNKAVRSESTVMGNSMVQVFDGTSGWMIRPTMMGGTGEPEDMPADQLKQQKGQLDPFGPLVDYKQKGNKVELVGKEKVDKKDNYHLKVTTPTGDVLDEYIDANTYLLTKTKATANGQEIEINFSEYKEVEGVKFAYTMDMTTQMGNLTFITSKIKLNGPVDENIFKKPK